MDQWVTGGQESARICRVLLKLEFHTLFCSLPVVCLCLPVLSSPTPSPSPVPPFSLLLFLSCIFPLLLPLCISSPSENPLFALQPMCEEGGGRQDEWSGSTSSVLMEGVPVEDSIHPLWPACKPTSHPACLPCSRVCSQSASLTTVGPSSGCMHSFARKSMGLPPSPREERE